MARFTPGHHGRTYTCDWCGRAGHESEVNEINNLKLCAQCAEQANGESPDVDSLSALESAIGIFGSLIGSIRGNSDSLDNCPYCGGRLIGFGCLSCDVEFVMQDGKLVERALSRRGGRRERRCISCDTAMKHGGEFVAAWQDGDNEDAYVRCPSCGYENIF